MELKPGYKLTETGVIPEEWVVLPIGSVVTEFRGGAPLKPTDFTDIGVKVLPKGGVGRTGRLRIAEKDIQYCSPQYANLHPRNQVDSSYTIVVLRDLVPSGPSIGLMVEIDTDERYVLAQGVYGFRLSAERTDPRYLIQLSNTAWYRNIANSIMVGSTQVHITNTAFKGVQIPLPLLSEQRAIATALADVDSLLAKLDQIITKKRDLKQAAMQQLLTGQTRLPRFSGEWTAVLMREVLAQSATYGIVTAGPFVHSGIKMVRGGDIVRGRINTELPLVSHEKASEHSRTCLVKDDVVIALVGYPGASAKIPEELIGANISRAVGLLRLNDKVAAEYLVCLLNSSDGRRMVLAPSAGSAQQVVNLDALNKLQFNIPPISEQTAIAAVFSDMDAELTAIEARREKTRSLKQGMMQELLTGRTRLV